MICRQFLAIIILLFSYIGLLAQQKPPHFIYLSFDKNTASQIPSNYAFFGISAYHCKQVYIIYVDTSKPQKIRLDTSKPVIAAKIKKPDFITVHGNVMYDYYYQSYVDTPFTGSALQQHTISTYLDITVKDAYPFKMSFTTRFGNTNYLSDLSALSLRFDKTTFIRNIKQKAQDWASKQLSPDSSRLNNLKDSFENKLSEYKKIRQQVTGPSSLQLLIAAKEKLMSYKNKQTNGSNSKSVIDSVAASDSVIKNITLKYNEKLKRADSLKKDADSLWLTYLKEKKNWDSTKTAITSSVGDLKNPQKWKEGLNKIANKDSLLPKGYKNLLAVNKLNIGTSVVDYSELSAKNITITGLQVEYVPRLYYAVAGGVINYRFRDYLLPEQRGPKQYLGLVRFGKGSPDSDHLIFTYYFGKKQLYSYYTLDTNGNYRTPNFSLMGITIEKRVSLTRNVSLTAEVAKSTIPYYNRANQNSKITQGVFNFNDRSNEAYSLKAEAAIPVTHTKLDGYFKRYGENFQSFTLFSSNTRQTAWLMHAEQMLLKNQLTVNASIRKNDYVNPFLNQQYTSNIIFKSFQASLHVKKLPVITVGYFPTSQLTKFGDNQYSENLFYNLIGSLNYYYRLLRMQMSSSVMATRFYNKPLDSGFVYYNSKNILFSHLIFLKNFTVNSEFTKSYTNTYSLSTVTGGMQWKAKKWLLLGGSLKYNHQSVIDAPQIGYGVNTSLIIPSIGNIQLRIQKSYLPGPDAKLVPDNIGRLTYYRNF